MAFFRVFITLLLLTSTSPFTEATVTRIHGGKTAAKAPSPSESNRVYIVYLGARQSETTTNAHTHVHMDMLSRVLGSSQAAKDSILYSYTNSFTGFAAVFSDQQAASFRAMDAVVSVFPSKMMQQHTTGSWQYLGLSTARGLWPQADFGSDIIVGVIDSGVWPESESFQDSGFGPIPSKWNGGCVTGEEFGPENCNRKLIGARYYYKGYEEEFGSVETEEYLSPRDANGHGSHTASTAAGSQVPGASFLGVASGTASGGVPSARLAIYKACFQQGCADADLLAAFDDAIADGVDIISISIGSDTPVDYQVDSIAIGSFHAVDKGILVSSSGGNSGPASGSIGNVAPWLFTVGANRINRIFIATVQLGNGESYEGQAINTYAMDSSYPLVYGGDIPASSFSYGAETCDAGSLDEAQVAGKIILCYEGFGSLADETILGLGGAGVIIIGEPSIWPYLIPTTVVTSAQGDAILEYINSNSSAPTALIEVSKTGSNESFPITMIDFSSVGPSSLTPDISKPDITAPGVDILAAWSPVANPSGNPDDNRTANFNIISGTSMACPHVAGAAALLKSVHPDWSPAAIKSALMTTATPLLDSIELNTGLATGSGEINPTRAADPGLVFNTSTTDYVQFLCAIGYSSAEVALVSGKTQPCPSVSPVVLDLNYPSIFLNSDTSLSHTAKRTLTNVGPAGVYRATVVPPDGVDITVTPTSLSFSALNEMHSFTVGIAVADYAFLFDFVFGSIVWSDGTHSVRIPIGVGPAFVF